MYLSLLAVSMCLFFGVEFFLTPTDPDPDPVSDLVSQVRVLLKVFRQPFEILKHKIQPYGIQIFYGDFGEGQTQQIIRRMQEFDISVSQLSAAAQAAACESEIHYQEDFI